MAQRVPNRSGLAGCRLAAASVSAPLRSAPSSSSPGLPPPPAPTPCLRFIMNPSPSSSSSGGYHSRAAGFASPQPRGDGGRWRGGGVETGATISTPSAGSCNSTPCLPSAGRSDNLVASVEESASALTLQEPDVSSPEELHDATSLEEESNTESDDASPPSASSHGPKILFRSHPNWSEVYFIRMNRQGSFYVYPDLGGPFQSIHEAEDAINRHVCKLQRPSKLMEQDKMSYVDRLVYEAMHYADGKPKRGPNSRKRKGTECGQRYLVQALVEQYNDNHNLLGLESLLREEWIYENDRWFYHFNFTTKTKEANYIASSSYLFFAEVSQHMQGEDAWEVNCCCIIDSKDDGHCFRCRNNGTPDMQHPNDTGAYTGGHLDGCFLPFGGDERSCSEGEEDEEARLRHIYKGLDDPAVLEKIYSYFD